MMCYKDFYSRHLGFKPYSYQNKVAELLLSNKNVILSVPTGAGKTWASIMPFLYAKQAQLHFPSKLIYSLPLRSLTNSIYDDVKNVVKGNSISIQTGELAYDPYFESDIVFSTIDQTLSNFLCFPLSLSHNQANINAGALVGSYLVFDEFHLLDSKLSMSTTLGMLRMLKNMCRVCIMTATLSDNFLHYLKNEFDPQNQFNFEIVTLADFPNDRKEIKSLAPACDKPVKKSVFVTDEVLTGESIIKKHKNKSIVICNRVERAQQIFENLQENLNGGQTKLLCIHSRFFDSDRKTKEVLIKKYFGKDSNENDVILVATQVIEAGMDISCDTMHTEISPINSFLQRAGRCARFENEYGEVFVYDVLNIEEKDLISELKQTDEDKQEIRKLNNKYLPYDKELCCTTFQQLKTVKHLDDKQCKTLVNNILSRSETIMINNMVANIFNFSKIEASWRDCNKKHYRETIRDIQSLELVLVDLEKLANSEIVPWQYETISVYKWSFISWAKMLNANKLSEDDWIIAKAESNSSSQFDFEWEDESKLTLKRLDIDEIKIHYDIVFVDNRYFDYSNECGLMVRLNSNQTIFPLKNKEDHLAEVFAYTKDTFYEHNKGLINCFDTEYKHNLGFTLIELNRFWGERFNWEHLIKMVLCFHDYGKLNKYWQKPMLDYQRKKTNNDSYNEVLAHTDYNSIIDFALGKECRIDKRPPHAGIGAMRIYDIVYDKFEKNEGLARALSSAILKHHSTDSSSFCSFDISKTALKDLNRILNELGFEQEPIRDVRETGENLSDCECSNIKEKLLYFIFVRILRLCDQKATENLEKYYKT